MSRHYLADQNTKEAPLMGRAEFWLHHADSMADGLRFAMEQAAKAPDLALIGKTRLERMGRDLQRLQAELRSVERLEMRRLEDERARL